MERILKITIDLLRGATYDYETKFTQADSQSHYLQIDFRDTSLNFSGVSMKVNFIRSDGVAVTTSKASVTSSNKVQIPTNALAKFGELGIEIILIKGNSILTVNKLIRVTVIKTLAGEGIDLEIGDSFLNEINQLTVNLSKVLTGEGDKQIERVRATGNEVVKQVESILGNNPEGGNAAAVGGLSRAGIETLIDNVVGKVEDGKFPLTSAEVGKVYEAVNGKKYKCIKAYSGSSLSTPNANFIEMSLNNHADRLDNLCEIFDVNKSDFYGLENFYWCKKLKYSNGLLEYLAIVRLRSSNVEATFSFPEEFIDIPVACANSFHAGKQNDVVQIINLATSEITFKDKGTSTSQVVITLNIRGFKK